MAAPKLAMYGWCLLLALTMCIGQVLFKLAAQQQPADAFSFGRLLGTPWFVGAVVLYGASTILWVYILARMPLSIAYPFSLLGAALVPVAAYTLFGEPMGVRVWIGIALVLTGLFVMNVK
ncbi:MAG: SMR family transporter [Rhodospirillaceae bacterium]|nr:SMR family transporter [Rhodospirillaceae bacterium]